MQISSDSEGPIQIVAIQGSLDTDTSREAESYLSATLNDGAKKLLIDFSTLEYISSAGLRVLLAIAKGLGAQGGELRLCSLNETVKDVFDISGFNMIFKVFQTRSEAMEEF